MIFCIICIINKLFESCQFWKDNTVHINVYICLKDIQLITSIPLPLCLEYPGNVCAWMCLFVPGSSSQLVDPRVSTVKPVQLSSGSGKVRLCVNHSWYSLKGYVLLQLTPTTPSYKMPILGGCLCFDLPVSTVSDIWQKFRRFCP